MALILHPLQYAFVQVLEGYWGASKLAGRVRAVRMRQHWSRIQGLNLQVSNSQEQLSERGPAIQDPELKRRFRIVSRWREADRLVQAQPLLPDQVLPTRLGNTLRFYELSAGKPFGLEAVAETMPYLARVASPSDMAYVNDRRSQMDLAVRLAVMAMFACGITIVFMWRDGVWLLITLLPYSLAYLSYRGSIVAARQYGRAVAVAIALNRFALYERLRMPMPANTEGERRANNSLRMIMSYNDAVSLEYNHHV